MATNRENVSHSWDGMPASKKHRTKQPYITNRSHQDYSLLTSSDYTAAEEEAKQHCNKKFVLKDKNVEGWSLPPVASILSQPPWKDDELLTMKHKLNEVKGQLEGLDFEDWHNHTHNVNPARSISYFVKTVAKPEFLTQAWIKFFEILNAYPVIPVENELQYSCFNSVHLCEAPGAFIVALNHYLALNRKSFKFKWLANTLNPYYEGSQMSDCISDDRFMLHTLPNWIFGKDTTGDLMSVSCLDSLVEASKKMGSVHLVTADGSFDCQGNPAEQEPMTHALHVCEVIAALSILAKGGSLVIKKFTFFESNSVGLLYFLACVFEELHVYKPVTSKLGNSEVYTIGLNYHGKSDISCYLDKLTEVYGKEDISAPLIGKKDVPEAFLERVKTCAKEFMDYQVNAIKRNLSMYVSPSERSDQYLNLLKNVVLQEFQEKNPCHEISQKMWIVQGRIEIDRVINPFPCNYRIEGMLRKMLEGQKISFLSNELNSLLSFYHDMLMNKWPAKEDDYIIREVKISGVHIDFTVMYGKPFNSPFISRFCNTLTLELNKQLVDEYKKIQVDYLRKTGKNISDELLSVCHQHKVPSCVKKLFPDAQVFHDKEIFGISGKYDVLEDVLLMLQEESLADGGNLILVNVSVLTRLQYGLLLAITSVFRAVYFCVSMDNFRPFLVLQSLTSKANGIGLVNRLQKAGWKAGGSAVGLLEIVDISCLISSNIYEEVCHYNASKALYHSCVLLDIIKSHK